MCGGNQDPVDTYQVLGQEAKRGHAVACTTSKMSQDVKLVKDRAMAQGSV